MIVMLSGGNVKEKSKELAKKSFNSIQLKKWQTDKFKLFQTSLKNHRNL